jgi:nitrate/nitrite transporter NarK
MGLSDSAVTLSLSAGLLIGIGLSGTSFSVILGVVGRAVPPEKRSMGMGIASAAGSFGQFAMLPGTLGLIGWLGWSAALLVLGLLVALIVPLVSMLKDKPCQSLGHEQTLAKRCARPVLTPDSGCWHSVFLSAVSRWCSSACICRRIWWINTCRRRSAPRCWH